MKIVSLEWVSCFTSTKALKEFIDFVDSVFISAGTHLAVFDAFAQEIIIKYL